MGSFQADRFVQAVDAGLRTSILFYIFLGLDMRADDAYCALTAYFLNTEDPLAVQVNMIRKGIWLRYGGS